MKNLTHSLTHSLLCYLVVLGFAVLAPQEGSAAGGVINFGGKVVAPTCSFAINGGSAAVEAVGTVTLPNVFTGALVVLGATTGDTAFNIKVSLCDPILVTLRPKFSGAGIDVSTGNMLNTGTAANVEVQLLNGYTGAPLPLNAVAAVAQGSPVGILTGGATTLRLIARYIATGAATAGTVTSSVNFDMQYQ